jgi:hypothetical protein
MCIEELRSKIDTIFSVEPDDEGVYPRDYPNAKIRDVHNLDFSYMDCFPWERSTTHRYTRQFNATEGRMQIVTSNWDVPWKLCEAGLRLLADSIIEYHGKMERKGNIRFYPPIIMTFWSGFETFVRYASEVMLITVKRVPEVVRNYLLEREVTIEKGEQRTRVKYWPVLNRYEVLLRYGYNFKIDRGNKYWQSLENAKELRDYYTHLDVSKPPRPISSVTVFQFLESVMMAVIWPSCALERTIFFQIYRLYDIWDGLLELQEEEFIEQPFFTGINFDKGSLFHCNFENVDTERFPNWEERISKDSKI